MPYANFTLETCVNRFQLDLTTQNLFPELAIVEPTAWLTESLDRGASLPLLSEKARSEFIVAPVLLWLRQYWQNQIAIYSGQRFDVDPADDLVGECDFILAATEPVPIVRAPIVSIIEAKRGDIDLGLGQCAAQMVATLRFNERSEKPTPAVYGCVTTGSEWQFLRLQDRLLAFDTRRLYIQNVGEILGAFAAIFRELAPFSLVNENDIVGP